MNPKIEQHHFLFSCTSVIPTIQKYPPAIIVGLPRSGSTFLSYLLSRLENWYFLDDLYFYQEVEAIHATEKILTPEQLQKLIAHLQKRTQYQLQIKEGSDGKELVPQFSPEDIQHMSESVLNTFKESSIYWYELLEEWMTRLTLFQGTCCWGYKTPQDFFHLETLFRIFPGLRVIFLIRDPRAIMTSLKYVSPSDGTPKQYHPIVYSRYWRLAIERLHDFIQIYPNHILALHFENLIVSPTQEIKKIAQFLGSSCPSSFPLKSPNSSFREGQRKSITPTEVWICERIAGKALQSVSYSLTKTSPRFRDIPEMFYLSFRFLRYQSYRFYKSPQGRKQILAFLKVLLKKRVQK